MWSSVSPLTITETLQSNDSNIFLLYATRHHGDNFPFDGKGGVLAHAFYPDSGQLSGQVHFDDAEWWSHETDNGTSILTLLTNRGVTSGPKLRFAIKTRSDINSVK